MIANNQNPLSRLSDSQIIKKLDALVTKERETILEVLRHLIEMDRRSLYLGRGYASLFEYCTHHLGYSESAAFRRIQTARCIRDFPEVSDMLKKNEVNLTTVSQIAGIITDENKAYLLRDIRHKSTRQVEAIVAKHNPRTMIKDRVRTIFLRSNSVTPSKVDESNTQASTDINIKSPDSGHKNSLDKNWGKFTSGAGGKKPCTLRSAQVPATTLQRKYKLEFAVEPECMKKVEEARAILSKKYPNGVPLGTLLEEVLDVYLEKKSPERKIQRREKRRAKAKAKKSVLQGESSKAIKGEIIKTTAGSQNKKAAPAITKRSRHIPQAVQDKIFARDGGRCSYVGANGMRCGSTWNLEIDHIQPYARGGDHSIQNLRLLCAKHNKLEAERVYGRKFMVRRSFKAKPLRE